MANEWNKPAFVEFETMLRRHLRRGAAPVAACAGFDLDAASAYLEGALGESHRASYESHLAGCAVCRSHLIGLARLAQAAPRVEAQPVTVMDQTPAWARWREVATGWFNFSAWKLKWQIAGATGAAFAILIAALGAQSWRHASNRASIAFTEASATPPPMAELTGQPLQSPTTEPSLQDAATIAGNLIALHSAPSVPVPTPPVGPIGNARDVNIEASGGALAVSSSQLAEAPTAPKPSGVEAMQSPPPQLSAESLAAVSRSVLSDHRKDSREQVAKEPLQSLRITPPHGYNPMNPGQAEPDPSHRTLAMSRDRTPPAPSTTGLELESLPDKIKRKLFSIGKLGFSSESEQRAEPNKQEASNNEAPKPMQVMIRDKIFCFEKCKGPDLEKIRGMWIDREYDFEKQKWNIWTLKSGSEEYKQVLADEPLLKEFFDHRPILIVWKNRIYKVLK